MGCAEWERGACRNSLRNSARLRAGGHGAALAWQPCLPRACARAVEQQLCCRHRRQLRHSRMEAPGQWASGWLVTHKSVCGAVRCHWSCAASGLPHKRITHASPLCGAALPERCWRAVCGTGQCARPPGRPCTCRRGRARRPAFSAASQPRLPPGDRLPEHTSAMSASSRVEVGNLAPTTTKQALEDFFSFCGTIEHVDLTPGSSRAAVTFANSSSASNAAMYVHGFP